MEVGELEVAVWFVWGVDHKDELCKVFVSV